jgi:hypothetical protein
MSTIIWIHEDCLHPTGPAYMKYPDAPSVFVFDDAGPRFSLKRYVFVYESLLELPCVIRKGPAVEQILDFARRHGATRVATIATPSPRLKRIQAELAQHLEVEVLPFDPFLEYNGAVRLERFSQFWRTVEPYAMLEEPRPEGDQEVTIPGSNRNDATRGR